MHVFLGYILYRVIFPKSGFTIRNMMISAIKVRKMLSKGCTGFLAHVMSKVESGPSINEMLIIQEFLDVFF